MFPYLSHEFFTSAEKCVRLRKFPVVLHSKHSVCVYAQSRRKQIAKLEVLDKCRYRKGDIPLRQSNENGLQGVCHRRSLLPCYKTYRALDQR
jgi:hypothetical protein